MHTKTYNLPNKKDRFVYQKSLIRTLNTSLITTNSPLSIHNMRRQIQKGILNRKSSLERSFYRFLAYKINLAKIWYDDTHNAFKVKNLLYTQHESLTMIIINSIGQTKVKNLFLRISIP